MFDILFGWRQASKCKNLIKCVQCRLKFLKSKRHSIIKHMRDNVASLLKNGQYESAFSRVEQLFKDQCLLAAYDLLDYFCEYIIIHLPYIRRHKSCPSDINEALSSVTFAAARCGDLPELQMIRKLFGERYGQKFVKGAIELHPGNLVNCQIREKLCIKSVPDEAKLRLIGEIAKDYNLQCYKRLKPQQQQLYGSGDCQWKVQILEEANKVHCDSIAGAHTQASHVMGSLVDASLTIEPAKLTVKPLNISPMLRSSVKVENFAQIECIYEAGMIAKKSPSQSISESCGSNKLSTASMEHKVKPARKATTCQSSFPFCRRRNFGLDDVEEFQSTTLQNCSGEDQSVFIFNVNLLPQRCNYRTGKASLLDLSLGNHGECLSYKTESWDWKACSQNSSNRMKLDVENLKRRFICEESATSHSYRSPAPSMNGWCELYYGKSCSCSPNKKFTCHQTKNQTMMSTQEIRTSSLTCHEKHSSFQQLHYAGKKVKVHFDNIRENSFSSQSKYNEKRSCCHCKFSCHMDFSCCCLEHPCYFCTSNDKDDGETLLWRLSGGMPSLMSFPAHNREQDGRIKKRNSYPQELNRKRYKKYFANCNVMESWNRRCNKQIKKLEGEEGETSDCQAGCVSSQGSCSRGSSPHIGTVVQAPYTRVMTMYPDRPKVDAASDSILSDSCHSHNSNKSNIYRHVHPKLPDYDDLAAKFMALKKEYMQSREQRKLALA